MNNKKNVTISVLCEKTNSAETFLLASAALANLTFMEPSAVHAMLRHETVRVLVSAVLHHPGTSLIDDYCIFLNVLFYSIMYMIPVSVVI